MVTKPTIDNLLAGDEAMGNDKGYELSTHEKQAEFARKRNYDYKGKKMSQLEKWSAIGFMLLVFGIAFMGWKAADMKQECRIEVMKAGRSAEDIVKICP